MIKLHKGQKVTYNPDYDRKETGMVKSICDDGEHAFVVYNCAGNWHKYENYTAARTKIKDLEDGWNAEVDTPYSDEYFKYLRQKKNDG